MWGAFFRRDENMETNVNSGKKLAVYIAHDDPGLGRLRAHDRLVGTTCSASSLSAALRRPHSFNNAIMAGVLGPILLLALYPRVKHWGLLWTEIMEPEEVSASRLQKLGNILVWVGGIGGVGRRPWSRGLDQGWLPPDSSWEREYGRASNRTLSPS